ncbi:helix-turn-helix transcriptional regulator [Haloarcula salina]|uniref:helix-turn-helix transcriptional regulator n=1 Tax=Haloarcula salina TaxID=1429914 RepID=UPI003C6FF42B
MTPRVSGALLLVLVAVLATLPLATAATPSAAAPLQQTTATPEPVAENTTFSLAIRENGDARWTITDTYALETENESRDFSDFGEDFANGDAEVGWLDAFRTANDAASTATGREMEITAVSRNYTVSDRKGQLVLAFTWTNFATRSGEDIVVGDAFNTTGGTWFNSLTEDQRLVISPPTGYGVESAPSAVDDGKLTFEGPRTFEPGYLSIVYTGEQSLEPTETGTPGPFLGDGGSLWIGGAVLAVLLIGAVGYMVRQGHTGSLPAAGRETDDEHEGSVTESPPEAETEDDVDVELLSDEERVERLLEENGGRMKQARIVTETGWSNAKVSQLLSSMDEDDRIDKLRIGRENLISFPDEDITDFDE